MEPQFNFLAIVLATLVMMGVGTLWYGPLFGKYWMKLKGYTPEHMKAMKMTPKRAMILVAISSFLTALVIALLVNILSPLGAGGAFMTTLLIWIGFIVPVLFHNVLFEEGSVKLWLFNSAYQFVALLGATLIIVLWT